MEQRTFDYILKKLESEKKPVQRQPEDIDKIIKLCESACLNLGFIWKHGETEKQAINAIFNSNGAMFLGEKGTGKTLSMQLASKIWGYLRGNYAFISTDKLSLKFANEGAESLLMLEKIPLFLDDLGTEMPTYNSYGNKVDVISTLLFMRYESKAPTFCTTNLTIEQLKERYGERLADRFKQMFVPVIFKGESKRGN